MPYCAVRECMAPQGVKDAWKLWNDSDKLYNHSPIFEYTNDEKKFLETASTAQRNFQRSWIDHRVQHVYVQNAGGQVQTLSDDILATSRPDDITGDRSVSMEAWKKGIVRRVPVSSIISIAQG